MAKTQQPVNNDNYENKDNFGAFNDYNLDYEDELEEEEKPKDNEPKFKGELFQELEEKPKQDPYDVLNDQYSMDTYNDKPTEEEAPPKEKKTVVWDTSKLVKYAIYAFCALIVIVLLIGIFSSGGKKVKKETRNENLNLSSGEKYSFASEVGDYNWESTDTSVAIVSTTGEVEAIGEGTAIVTITSDKLIIEYQVTVKNIDQVVAVTSVKMDKNNLDLATGDEYLMQVTIYPNNASNSDLSWFSSNDSIATVDSNGMIKAIGVGSCTITVKSSNGNSDVCIVKVTKGNGKNVVGEIEEIKIDVDRIVLKSGTEYTINYEVVPQDAEGYVEWSSSDEKIATVEDGVIKTISQGTITVVAKNGKVSSTLYVTVVKGDSNTPDVIDDGKTIKVEAITLNQTSIALAKDKTYTLVATVAPENATDKTVKWVTSNDKIVKVDANGNIQAVANGTAIITATSANGKSASCNVTVKDSTPIEGDYKVTLNQNTLSLNINDSATLVPTVTPNNYVAGMTWSSNNTKVATVTNGVVKAVGAGSAVVTVTLSNGAKANCTVNVSGGGSGVVNPVVVKLNPEWTELAPNKSVQIVASVMPPNTTNKTIKWSSSNTKVATVDGNGKVTAKSTGIAYITASASNGVRAQATIVVKGKAAVKLANSIITVGINDSVPINLFVENASRSDLQWESSDPNIAIVDADGVITGVGIGKTNIIATLGGNSTKCTVIVKENNFSISSILSDLPRTVRFDKTYDSTAKVNGREYKIYKQRYYRNNPFAGNGDIADNGAAAVALSIVLSGYSDIDPIDVANYMKFTSFERIAFTADYYGMNVSKIIYYNSLIYDHDKYESVITEVKRHLNDGNEILAYISEGVNDTCEKYRYSGNDHYIAILGIQDDGQLIIGNPGLKDGSGTIEELLTCYMKGNGKGLILLNKK